MIYQVSRTRAIRSTLKWMSIDTRRETQVGPGSIAAPTILLAPDSFKGTLRATSVSAALARGVLDAGTAWRPSTLPLADGGEGTLDALERCLGGRWFSAPARDPWGVVAHCRFLIVDRPLLGLPAPIAAVEWSAAAGFVADRNAAEALTADSTGVGELIAAARREGCRSTLIALGGSATTDGGAGLLRALGARLLDGHGAPLRPGGAALRRLAAIDLSAVSRGPLVALADVTSPLLGGAGTVARFAGQKGAGGAARSELDAALARWAEVLDPQRRWQDIAGGGAAGGAGFGLAAALGATLLPGAATVADLCGLDVALARADRVWTGEGRLDGTSAAGKVVSEVLRRATVPVDLVGGDLGPGAEALHAPGLHRIVTLVDPPGAPPPRAWQSLALPLHRGRALRAPVPALERLARRLIEVTPPPSERR